MTIHRTASQAIRLLTGVTLRRRLGDKGREPAERADANARTSS